MDVEFRASHDKWARSRPGRARLAMVLVRAALLTSLASLTLGRGLESQQALIDQQALPQRQAGSATATASAMVAAAQRQRRQLQAKAHQRPKRNKRTEPGIQEGPGAAARGGEAAATAAARCPPLTAELAQRRAGGNATLMLTTLNEAYWDFGMNWLHHVKQAGIGYYIIAATDHAASARLAGMGEPCFEWVDAEAAALGELLLLAARCLPASLPLPLLGTRLQRCYNLAPVAAVSMTPLPKTLPPPPPPPQAWAGTSRDGSG